MFIDASVIVAILAREPGCLELEKRLADAGGPFFVSPLAKFEAVAGLARQKSVNRQASPDLLRQAQHAVDIFIGDIEAEEEAISPEIGRLALAAGAAYGKKVGHGAGLNFGDCFSYACAKALNVGLCYKGDDFAQTDLA